MCLEEIKELIKHMLSNHMYGMIAIKENISKKDYFIELEIRIIYTESTKKPITDEIVTVHTYSHILKEINDEILLEIYKDILQHIAITAVVALYNLKMKLKSYE